MVTGDDNTAYNAGRIEDIIRLDPIDSAGPLETPVILAACHRSGVWQINKAGVATRSPSSTWRLPRTRCLAAGIYPGGRHVHAVSEALNEIIVLACEKGLVFSPIPNPGGLYKFSL